MRAGAAPATARMTAVASVRSTLHHVTSRSRSGGWPPGRCQATTDRSPSAARRSSRCRPAKPVAPVAVKPAPAPVKVVETVQPAVTPAPPVAAKPVEAPKPFAVPAFPTAAWLEPTLALTRAFGAVQAKMLDHACAELKATLGEVETLARTQSTADAVALQAKAFRRSYESLAAHLGDLAATARQELPRR